MHLMDSRDEAELIAALEQLQQAYDVDASSWELVRIAGGYQILTRPEYHTWVARSAGLPSVSAPRLTPMLLETLAMIAYEQPISRATLEAIRGANAAEALRQLQEQGWIRVVGREKSLGRPPLYGTTTRFLRRFGLDSLDDLPPLTTELHPNEPTQSAESPHPPIS
jgi:segregation and condensation protein B